MGNFARPTSWSLTILSVLWILIAVWSGVHFAQDGNIIGAVLVALFGLAAGGLWFQSRIAAWSLIAFASMGIVFALLKIGQVSFARTGAQIGWCIWSIMLLWEYLTENRR
jgi:hypothetical protein